MHGLKLLKKESIDLKSSPELLKDYWLFKMWFNHQVVPVDCAEYKSHMSLKV